MMLVDKPGFRKSKGWIGHIISGMYSCKYVSLVPLAIICRKERMDGQT